MYWEPAVYGTSPYEYGDYGSTTVEKKFYETLDYEGSVLFNSYSIVTTTTTNTHTGSSSDPSWTSSDKKTIESYMWEVIDNKISIDYVTTAMLVYSDYRTGTIIDGEGTINVNRNYYLYYKGSPYFLYSMQYSLSSEDEEESLVGVIYGTCRLYDVNNNGYVVFSAHVGMGEFIYGSYNLNSGVKVENIHGWIEYVYYRYYGLHSIQGSTLVGSGNSFGSTIKYSELEQ